MGRTGFNLQIEKPCFIAKFSAKKIHIPKARLPTEEFSEIEALVATIDDENKESINIGDRNCNYDDPSKVATG